MRPRVQSAKRTGPEGAITPMMNATNSTQIIYAHNSTEGNQGMHGEGGMRAILQRPTKSAANKYRHIIQGGGAIAEEIDYDAQ